MPAEEKTYSLADADAYMIQKGSRDPLVGYKPQIGRSAKGFISCFEVQRGNPGDSERLEPMVRLHRKNTSVTPFSVSTDDGYSSGPNLDALTQMHVQQVSFSGAKGRKILGEETYQLPEYEKMRNDRSAVESSIFTFKHKCNMRRFCRHGLAGVVRIWQKLCWPTIYGAWPICATAETKEIYLYPKPPEKAGR